MRFQLAVLALIVLLTACEGDPEAYYTCYGGVKVRDLAECDFSQINYSLENCDQVELLDTGMILTDAAEVISAFNQYQVATGENLTFVNAEYYKMIRGTDYFRFNFFNHDRLERMQFFIDQYGVISQPQNCES